MKIILSRILLISLMVVLASFALIVYIADSASVETVENIFTVSPVDLKTTRKAYVDLSVKDTRVAHSVRISSSQHVLLTDIGSGVTNSGSFKRRKVQESVLVSNRCFVSVDNAKSGIGKESHDDEHTSMLSSVHFKAPFESGNYVSSNGSNEPGNELDEHQQKVIGNGDDDDDFGGGASEENPNAWTGVPVGDGMPFLFVALLVYLFVSKRISLRKMFS